MRFESDTRVFSGVSPIIHTPFREDPEQSVDTDALGRLTDDMIDWGAKAVVALGLASEPWTLTDEERDSVCEVVSTRTRGRTKFFVGIGGSTRVALERARRAARLGADGLMVLPPPDANEHDIGMHFRALAQEAGLPILIQDSPQVTGVNLDVGLLLRLAEVEPLLRSAKIEGPLPGRKIERLHEAGVEVIAGWGGLHLPESLRRGASGCMPGCDLSPALLRMVALAADDRQEEAHALYAEILPLLAFETQSLRHLILGAKHVLRARGLIESAAMRRPASGLDDQELRSLDIVVRTLRSTRTPGFSQPTTFGVI